MPFELFGFDPDRSLGEVARALGFGLDQMARALLLQDRNGLLMAVIPSNHRLDLEQVRRQTGRPGLEPAPMESICRGIRDCDAAAVPPLGELHGVEALVDDHFTRRDGVYFAPGTRGAVLRVQSDAFEQLHARATWGGISRPPGRLVARAPSLHGSRLPPAGAIRMPRRLRELGTRN